MDQTLKTSLESKISNVATAMEELDVALEFSHNKEGVIITYLTPQPVECKEKETYALMPLESALLKYEPTAHWTNSRGRSIPGGYCLVPAEWSPQAKERAAKVPGFTERIANPLAEIVVALGSGVLHDEEAQKILRPITVASNKVEQKYVS